MDTRHEVEMGAYLQDARLVVFDEASAQRNVLADFTNFDMATKQITFNINTGDYSDFFNDFSSKEMFVEFEWSAAPPTNIDVTYQVKIGSAYRYELAK